MSKMLSLAAAAVIALTVSAVADAAPVTYACPAGADCDGQTFATWIEKQDGLNYTFAYSVNTAGYKGKGLGAEGDFVRAISFSFGLGTLEIDDMDVIAGPGGAWRWKTNNEVLDAKGCGNFSDDDPGKAVCVGAKDYDARPKFTVGDVLTWKIEFEADEPLPSVAHLKYLYEGPLYETKIGKKTVLSADKRSGLMSFDFPVQDCTGRTASGAPDCGRKEVPEPASLLLLGAGLVLAASRLRRRA